jgi:DeoR family transcriptional regulator, aga operon transcriptional repressor
MRVREAGSVTVAGLEKELGISAATARRDLALLERQGKVKRTHGGRFRLGSRSTRTPSSSGWVRR